MAYNPTVWEENDLLSIDRMNKIENGIAAASSPTAQSISFDPQDTGLTAENVQDAIVEVYESSGVDLASDDEVTEMLNDVFGLPYSTLFEEIYGVTLSEEGTKVSVQVVGLGAYFRITLTHGATTASAVSKINQNFSVVGNHYIAEVNGSTGYIMITENATGDVKDYTLTIDGTQIYPAA